MTNTRPERIHGVPPPSWPGVSVFSFRSSNFSLRPSLFSIPHSPFSILVVPRHDTPEKKYVRNEPIWQWRLTKQSNSVSRGGVHGIARSLPLRGRIVDRPQGVARLRR